MTPSADLLSEPRRNARAPRADLPDPPACFEPNRLRVPKRRRIEQLGQRVEPLPGFDLLVVEQILLVTGHVPIMPLWAWGLQLMFRVGSASDSTRTVYGRPGR